MVQGLQLTNGVCRILMNYDSGPENEIQFCLLSSNTKMPM